MHKEGRSDSRRSLSSIPHPVRMLCCPDMITHPKNIVSGLAIAVIFLQQRGQVRAYIPKAIWGKVRGDTNFFH